MVFSNNVVGSFFGSIKNVAISSYTATVGNLIPTTNNQQQENEMNHPHNDPNHDLLNHQHGDDQQQEDGGFRPMVECSQSLSPNTTDNNMNSNRIEYAFPTCDVCLHEKNQIEPTNYYCRDCELALCREHVRRHYLDGRTTDHKIYDPRSNNIVVVNMELLQRSSENDQNDSDDSDDDIEIVKSFPISKTTALAPPHNDDNDDDFEHHQIFQASDSILDVNNLTEEEEEIINLNGQDFIYWTRLLKTYPHFCTNIIHTPLIIRKIYTNGTLGGSLLIDNRTPHAINVVLSQIGPLHQILIPPNRLGILEGVGRVHFTVEVGRLQQSNKKLLSNWDKALPIIGTVATGIATGVGIAAAVLTGAGLIGGIGLAIGTGLSSVSLASAPVAASVASAVSNKKQKSALVVNDNNDNNNSENTITTATIAVLEESSSNEIMTTTTNEITQSPSQLVTTEPPCDTQEDDDVINGYEIIDIEPPPQEVVNNKTDNTTTLSDDSSIERSSSTAAHSELNQTTDTSSPIGQVGTWFSSMKKLLPGKSTFPNILRGVFCDGHSVVIVTSNDDDVVDREDGHFNLELKTF